MASLKMLFHSFVIVMLSFNFDFIIAQDCSGHKTCGLCLQTPGCVWCKDPEFTKQKSEYARCGKLEAHRNRCNDLVHLEESKFTPIREDSSQPQLISPKGYTVKLGVQQKATIQMTYTDPGNKPLDLYYLMDLSATMEDDKEAVIKLGTQLAGALKSTTTDLQMGFGSFIDKPMMPFATLGQINLPETPTQTKPYGFRNHLNLTMDHAKFERAVHDAKISANLDAPEGGLDAIMQAIVCKDLIGWRDKARKILVLSTDGNFHIAGDGKLGGIVTPNDGRCHMENDLYTHSKLLDYPSISQIISKVQQEKIFIIFAVVEAERALYEEFAKHLHPFGSTIVLNSKSTDVDKLVQEQYNQIRSRVELILMVNNIIQSDNTKPFPFIELTYYSKCKSSMREPSPGYKCEGVIANEKLEFFIDVKLLFCPPKKDQWKPWFEISTGSSETLRVNLDLSCGCKCETESGGNLRKECGNQGEIQCGICACKPDYLGAYCQCPANVTTQGTYADDSKCKKNPGLATCSEKGTCICGQCVCTGDYSGEFCECNKRKCPVRNGVCSGNGVCTCEECRCNPGYKGEACECQDSEANCKPPGAKELCSGKAQCKCNECNCPPGIVGKYCQICMRDDCDCLPEVVEYVKCALTETPNATHVQKSENTAACVKLGQKSGEIGIEGLELRHSLEAARPFENKKCTIKFETRKRSDCILHYWYSYNSGIDKVSIGAQSELACSSYAPPASPLPIILITMGSILLIGIFTLLLWKIITYCHDKREYTRFEQERKGAKWGATESPLYKGPTTTISNPAYTHNE